MYKIGFDSEKYLQLQSEKIIERIHKFGGKLYLEFGGKLFDDYHASRVLPGFKPDAKLQMLLKLKDEAEIVIAINADAIATNKIRGDLGITYDQDVLRLIDAFRSVGLYVGSVVLTQYQNQPRARAFRNKLERLGVKTYRHYPIEGYPYDVNKIVSDSGYGANEYIETERSLVVVTAPGPGSGKMATCLSQLYQDNKKGIKSGYAKFETFPIWNLPLEHPVNIAYEAATADLNDVNMIDPFHLQAYGTQTVNYNRDIENFPVLNAIFNGIFGVSPYKSPTDMGVNMAGFCISDDEATREAARQEIIRRYYQALLDREYGKADNSVVEKTKALMMRWDIREEERKVIATALKKAQATGAPACALELPDGRTVVGKTSNLLGAASATLLKALNVLAGNEEHTKLFTSAIITPLQALKTGPLGGHNPRLHVEEILVALAISATQSPIAAAAIEALPLLRHSELHSSVILSPVDIATLKKLGVNVTCTPVFQTKKLYH
ncbi:MAG: DUF1846 domain-containing protein [Clostridia bacterium]|nr:DUF1846 domain-containing protein [Clostridia bacterium]